jgi:hypothetical protein
MNLDWLSGRYVCPSLLGKSEHRSHDDFMSGLVVVPDNPTSDQYVLNRLVRTTAAGSEHQRPE